MLMIIENQIKVYDASDAFKQWCKDNLILKNPDYVTKIHLGKWLGDTSEYIRLFSTDQEMYMLPFGTMSMLPKNIKDDAIILNLTDDGGDINYRSSIPLYDYQQDAVTQMLLMGSGILQAPAGSGKTQMGLSLAVNLHKKTLWLCHTLDLVKQSYDRALQYIDKSHLGMIANGKVDINDITFATIQTVSKLDLAAYKTEWPVIIVDEVHRVAGSPTSITQYYKTLNELSAQHKYGLSATVHRSDGLIQATYAIIGKVMYQVPAEAVKDKIMTVNVYPVNTGTVASDDMLNTDGTLNYAKLITTLCKDSKRNEIIVHNLMKFRDHPTLILSARLAHLKKLESLLPSDMQSEAVMISGRMTSKTQKAEREKAIEDMRSGKKKYLFATYSLAKEGLDIPCLEQLFMVTPQKDYAVITQAIGRIARTAPNKDNAVAFDFVDAMPYLQRMYKKRCTIYNKNGCKYVDLVKDGYK